MQYGYFDTKAKEYVIDRVDLPLSWTNYIGLNDMCGVFNHTAGGYLFCGSPEYHRITRFRANGVPQDSPGHYVYLRDDETGEYWSVSWQPVGKPLEQAKYRCRHGLSYSVYECDYNGISAMQRLSVAADEPLEIWDVTLTNTSDAEKRLSVFGYCEFSFHHIQMDNQNFQMSLYAAGSRYKDGVIEHDLYYEQTGYQFFTANFEPDGFDCLRDTFIGAYRTEKNPVAVEAGTCASSFEKGGNHCGALQKKLVLKAGETVRLLFLLGEGGIDAGRNAKERYADVNLADEQYNKTAAFWEKRLKQLQVETPDKGMDELLNIWTLYQSEINVRFSRFSSFIEVGGRTGLGYRDTAQDAMTIPHADGPACKLRLQQLLRALTSQGYGLHLFEPRWFEQEQEKPFRSPTVIPKPEQSSFVHSAEDACSDDALWLVGAVVNYVKETGDDEFLQTVIGFADGGEGSVYEHLKRILEFSAAQVGKNGIAKGLRADWNDCLNLGGGESAMVSFLHHWALMQFIELAEHMHEQADADRYRAMAKTVRERCEKVLWDGKWYIRGITADGRRIGTALDEEGKVHLESNTWAVLSGVASSERGELCMNAVKEYLSTKFGLLLCAPPYTKPDAGIGFVTRVYPGLKENAAIFSHPNPWAWAAECILGRGAQAMEYYDALCPYHQNDKIEVRQAEPYSYCQFVVGSAHTAFGRARHPFMTGSAGWSYFAATQYILGIRPDFDGLTVSPCIPQNWSGFTATRNFRGAEYRISVENPDRVSKGVARLMVNGCVASKIPLCEAGASCQVTVIMGREQ